MNYDRWSYEAHEAYAVFCFLGFEFSKIPLEVLKEAGLRTPDLSAGCLVCVKIKNVKNLVIDRTIFRNDPYRSV